MRQGRPFLGMTASIVPYAPRRHASGQSAPPTARRIAPAPGAPAGSGRDVQWAPPGTPPGAAGASFCWPCSCGSWPSTSRPRASTRTRSPSATTPGRSARTGRRRVRPDAAPDLPRLRRVQAPGVHLRRRAQPGRSWARRRTRVRLPAALFGALSVPLLYGVAVLLLRSWRRRALRRPDARPLPVAPAVHPGGARGQPAGAGRFCCWPTACCGPGTPARDRFRGWALVRPAPAWPSCSALYDYPGALVFAPLFVLVLGRAYSGRLLRRRGPGSGPVVARRRARPPPRASSSWTGAPGSASTRRPSSTSRPCACWPASGWSATCGTAPRAC